MKLHRRTFQIFWDVHAWGGVVSALLLYTMFFAGAFALFFPELDEWSQPRAEVAGITEPVRLDPLVKQIVEDEHALLAGRLAFMIHETGGVTSYLVQGNEQKDFSFDPKTGRLLPSSSGVGSFLYELHYLAVIPYGIYLAGLASMALFLAIVTGVLIHLKDLLRQWFQFRPERTRRTWSSDLHKVLGVFGLPFQLLYAWTGAVLCLASISVLPAFVFTLFEGDQSAAVAAYYGEEPNTPKPTGKLSGVMPNLDDLIEKARERFPGLRPSWIGIEDVGDEGSHVSLYGKVPNVAFGAAEVTFRSSDGAVLRATGPGTASPLQRFEGWFYGLHYARFGGYPAKVLYALLAFATCAVIITGNLVWLERRDARRASAGNRFLERLTVGVAAGLPMATASLFFGNRLLPEGLHDRGMFEQAFFWTFWLAMLIVPFVWRKTAAAAAFALLAAAVVFVLALGLDVASRSSSLSTPLHRSIDAGILLLAVTCGAAGLRLLRKGEPSSPDPITPVESE